METCFTCEKEYEMKQSTSSVIDVFCSKECELEFAYQDERKRV